MASIKQFDKKDTMLSREKKFPQGKELAYIILFGLTYCLDLYVYIGYKAVFKPMLTNEDNYTIVCAEIGGMLLLLLLFLLTFFINKIYFNLPIRNLFWICFGFQVFLTFATPSVIYKVDLYALCLFRFIEAIVVSLNLAIYLSVIGRNIGRKKRTWATTIVFSIGFLGPFFVNFIRIFTKNENIYLFMVLPSVTVLYALFVWKKYGTNDIFFKEGNNNYNNDKFEINRDIRSVISKGNFWKAVYTLFICGLSVQFSVRFLLAHSEIFTNDVDFKEYIYMMRYLGSTIGILFFGWFSVSFSKKYYHLGMYQIRLGERKIVFQMGMLFGVMALLGFNDFAHCISIFPPAKYIIPLFLGISNAIWCIIFLQAIETLGRKTQPILVFLLPIFLRIFWDFLSYERLDNLVGKGNPNFAVIIICIGCFVYLIGFIVSILWEDNFEGGNRLDSYDYNFTKGLASSLMNKEIRENIAAIDDKIIRSDNVEEYIEEVSKQVRHRFEEVFDTSLYYYNFVFLKENAETFVSRIQVFDNALEGLKKVRRNSIRNLFKWIRIILASRNDKDKGLASYSFAKEYEGLILADNKKFIATNLQADYEEANYKIFDLSKIPLPDEELIKRFWKKLSKMQREDFLNADKIKETWEMFSPIYKFTRESFPGEQDEEHFPEKIRRLLTLRATGAWCYPEGEYYIYIITPKDSKHKLKTSLLMATAAPIPIEKLSELRDLLDYVMLQKAYAMSLDAEWKTISFQQSHSFKTNFGYLRNKVDALNEARYDDDKFLPRVTEVKDIIHSMDEINTFNLEVERFKGNSKSANPKYTQPDPEGVNLVDMLRKVLTELNYSTTHLRTNHDEHPVNLKKLLTTMCKDDYLQIDDQIRLRIIPTAFRILITEILKNAFVHTDYKNPSVQITWTNHDDDYFRLSFTNNQSMRKEILDYINDSSKNTDLNKFGIITIKRILGFKQFNQTQIEEGEGGKWKLLVQTQTENYKLTTFNLLIPKTDIK